MAEPVRGLVLDPACQFSSLPTGAQFHLIRSAQEAIDAFTKALNEDAEPVVWTKSKAHQRRAKDAA